MVIISSRKRPTIDEDECCSSAESTYRTHEGADTAYCNPFFQVGGHTRITRLDALHVCKPVQRRELEFYRDMPEALAPVVPHFCGFTEGFSSTVTPSRVSCCPSCAHYAPTLRVPSELQDVMTDYDIDSDEQPKTKRRMSNSIHRVVLSDLTARFMHPCVIDLKMGTRQHADGASEEKRRRQTEKCAQSTSLQHGVRMCGMTYFDASTNRTVQMDKYAGRSMSVLTLSQRIRSFLSYPDGRPRSAICQVLLRKIEEIEEIVSSIDGLRLYGSSLLIVYDGSSMDEPRTIAEAESLVEVRVVDFANATLPGFLGDLPYHSGADQGFVLGLHTVQRFLSRLAAPVDADSETESEGSMSP